jgi:cysteinyl-tRNA synthetase
MSALSTELYNTAQSLQSNGQNPTAAQLFLLAAAQENAQDASAALAADANTATQIATITGTVTAQVKRLAQDISKAQTVVSIATNILTVIAGASNPLAVVPTLNTIVGELSS